jgi:hypothetical protein
MSTKPDDNDVRISEHVARLIADWPPLTPAQRDRIAALFARQVPRPRDRGEAA